jgi:hypothetical protein
MRTDDDKHLDQANRDPLTGAPGSHPVGSGLGAAVGGAAAGAALGTVAGPVGSVAGAVVGGVLGGLGGKALAEKIDPTVEAEDDYWRDHYLFETYVEPSRSYEDYRFAYRLGYETRIHYPHLTLEQALEALEPEYERRKPDAALTWAKARYATRAAWHRADRMARGEPTSH